MFIFGEVVLMERKFYKHLKLGVFTSSNVRFMLPGDLRVAGCFILYGGTDGGYFNFC